MNAIAVNEHLAQLLLVQAGLLDAYLEQNLGTRYAFAIVVCEAEHPRRVRAVTNFRNHGPVRAQVAQLTDDRVIQASAVIPVDRTPRLVALGE